MGRGGYRPNSGRPSAYEEAGRAKMLADMYYDSHSQEEIEAKIRKGKFSIRDRHILNAMEGDQSAISPIFSKLHPDKMDVKEETTLKVDF